MGIAHPKPQPPTIHKPEWDHGVDVKQTQNPKPDNLKPGNPLDVRNWNTYNGWNVPWRM